MRGRRGYRRGRRRGGRVVPFGRNSRGGGGGPRRRTGFALRAPAFRELGAAAALGGIEGRLGMPLIVKPPRQGSALGVKVVASQAEVPAAMVSAFSYDDRVLLERFVE